MAKKRANGEGSIRKRKDGRWEGRYTAGHTPEEMCIRDRRVYKAVWPAARPDAPFRQKRLDRQAWVYLPVLYRQRGTGKAAIRT